METLSPSQRNILAAMQLGAILVFKDNKYMLELANGTFRHVRADSAYKITRTLWVRRYDNGGPGWYAVERTTR